MYSGVFKIQIPFSHSLLETLKAMKKVTASSTYDCDNEGASNSMRHKIYFHLIF